MPAASVGVFRNPDFTRLFLADSLSQLGAAIAPIALPLAAIGLLHANAFQVGLLTVFETAAFLLIGLPAGAWVDRARRRPVMLWANTGRLLALGAVPLLWRLRVLTMPELLAVALVVGVLTVFFECAYQSYLPRLVEAEQLVDANARLQSAQSVARIAGPGLAGLMIGWLGAPYALLATAGGYGWAVLCVLRIRRREPAAPARPGTHLGQEIAEGLRFLFGHWLLLRATVCTSTFNFFYMMGEPMLVLVLARELRFSPSTIGVVFACGGVGGVLGSFLVNRLVERFGRGPALWGSAAVAGVAGLAAPLAATALCWCWSARGRRWPGSRWWSSTSRWSATARPPRRTGCSAGSAPPGACWCGAACRWADWWPACSDRPGEPGRPCGSPHWEGRRASW